MFKRLIINADDFGLTSGINYGILHAYLNHSISSTSLMVNAPKVNEAIDIMQRYAMNCVGIHINMTLGKPVSNPCDIPSLIDETGSFHQSDWWLHHQANEDELILEFDNQIALFKRLIGQMPTHINYHHRYDFYKYYPRLFQHLCKTYQLPMRLERDTQGYSYEYALNQSYFIEANQNIEDYLTADLIEMPCHVGFVDHEIMEISSMNMQRMEDSYLVNSQEFKKKYQSLGYQLISWNQIAKKED